MSEYCNNCASASHGVRELLGKLEAELKRITRLESARATALEAWEDAAQYKGEYLMRKHGDAEDIAELRALLPSVQAATSTECT